MSDSKTDAPPLQRNWSQSGVSVGVGGQPLFEARPPYHQPPPPQLPLGLLKTGGIESYVVQLTQVLSQELIARVPLPPLVRLIMAYHHTLPDSAPSHSLGPRLLGFDIRSTARARAMERSARSPAPDQNNDRYPDPRDDRIRDYDFTVSVDIT